MSEHRFSSSEGWTFHSTPMAMPYSWDDTVYEVAVVAGGVWVRPKRAEDPGRVDSPYVDRDLSAWRSA